MPTLLKTVHGFSTVQVGYHMVALTCGSFFGYLGAAYLSDGLGRRPTFLLFTVLNWIVIPAFLYFPARPAMLFPLDFALGFAALGIYSALGPFFTELFPQAIRATGQGFSYSFGRGVGAICPTLVGLMGGTLMPLRDAMALLGCGSYLLVLGAVALLPETRGRDLGIASEP